MANKPPRIATLKPRIATIDTRRPRPQGKQKDRIYDRPEYKQWREIVLGRADGKCQGAGFHAPAGSKLYPDHIVEIKDGGSEFDPANGQALCASCHTSKTVARRADRMRERY